MKVKHILITLLFLSFYNSELCSQETALEIIQKADEKLRGETSNSEIKMTIVRPSWQREMAMKSWSKGTELAIILITDPARDRGISFLKRDKELWNWQPSINRVIKMPPSMMMQSWMGSDFTNDDLVRESSIVEDYLHELIGDEEIDQRICYKIQLTPKENATVVWGKINIWIDKIDYMQMKTEMYDEDGYLVSTMYGKEIKTMGGKLLPSILEIIPSEEEGHKTIIEYVELIYNTPISDDFFSTRNLKRVR